MSVVIKQKDEIEIFVNQENGISICQKNYSSDEPQVIWFCVDDAKLICAAIKALEKQIRGK